MLQPQDMQLALRRRLRLPVPFRSSRCGPPGWRAHVDALDAYGDHALACPRADLLERRANEHGCE